jgi:hypothetical protein
MEKKDVQEVVEEKQRMLFVGKTVMVNSLMDIVVIEMEIIVVNKKYQI